MNHPEPHSQKPASDAIVPANASAPQPLSPSAPALSPVPDPPVLYVLKNTIFHVERLVEDFSQQKGDISIGVFYDPGMNYDFIGEYSQKTQELWELYKDEKGYDIRENDREEYYAKCDEMYREYEEKIKEQIAENLRNQVRDFIEWLQAQGII